MLQNHSPNIFHPTIRAWFGVSIVILAKAFLTFAIIIVLLRIFPSFVTYSNIIGFLVGVLIVAGILYHDVHQLLQTKLIVNEHGLFGRVGSDRIEILWKDTSVIRLRDDERERLIELVVVASHKNHNIPVVDFDGHQLRESIENCAPLFALSEDAVKGLPEYSEWEQEQREKMEKYTDFTGTLYGDYSLWVRVIAWGCFISMASYILYGLVLLQGPHQFDLSIILWLFPLLVFGFAVFKFSQRVEVTSNTIAVVTWFGRREIKWKDVRHIKYNIHPVSSIEFEGGNDKIIAVGLNFWSKAEREKVMDYITVQIRRLGIETSISHVS